MILTGCFLALTFLVNVCQVCVHAKVTEIEYHGRFSQNLHLRFWREKTQKDPPRQLQNVLT